MHSKIYTSISSISLDPVAGAQLARGERVHHLEHLVREAADVQHVRRAPPPASCAYGWMSMQTSLARGLRCLERSPTAASSRSAAAPRASTHDWLSETRITRSDHARSCWFSHASGALQFVPPPPIAASLLRVRHHRVARVQRQLDARRASNGSTSAVAVRAQHRRRHQRRDVDAADRRRRTRR